MKEQPVFINKDEFPASKFLQNALKEKYSIYNNLKEKLTNEPYNLIYEWRYYKDGKSWLCKIIYKKKTVMWLSVFDGYFKVAFYFSAKLSEGIDKLELDEKIKTDFQKRDFIGKVKPLIINVLEGNQIKDIQEIVLYKKKY
ncbi:DUF3788 domain-containing protein [bacterium]|nr:DUF3788 domain-containing protein [bacterium]